MRRLVLLADLSLDGLLGRDGLAPDWAREYDDQHLAAYHRRVVLKAGVHAAGDDWTVGRLRALLEDGGDDELAPVVVQGSPALCQELTRQLLVDEYRLTVHPVVLGEGHRLFTAPDPLHLINLRPFASGSIAYTYVPERAYQLRPPPYPWDAEGPDGSARSERPGEHDDDPEAEDTT